MVGGDGRCSTCGVEYVDFVPGITAASDIEPPADEIDDSVAATAPEPPLGDDEDWSKRRLCSDGACTGVLDANDKCQTCGKVDVAYHHDLD